VSVDTGEKCSKNTEDSLLSNWKKAAGVPEQGRNKTAVQPWGYSKSTHHPSHASSTTSHIATSKDKDYIEGEFDQDENKEDLNITQASKLHTGQAGKEHWTTKVKL
jgi:hypothetical protein